MSSTGEAPAREDAPEEVAREGRALTRHAGVLAVSTLMSRVTGFLRDAAILAVFGASGSALWFVAWRLPNVMRRLVAEGSLTIAFIPLFTGRLQAEGKEGARRFLNKVFTATTLALTALVALAIWGMPLILGLLAGDWQAEPGPSMARIAAGCATAGPAGAAACGALGGLAGPVEAGGVFAFLVELSRWTFPYLLLVTLVAVAMGVLNTLRRFFVPAASPVLVNLSIVVGALVFTRIVPRPMMALAWALLIGGVLQLAVNLVAMARAGYAPRPDLRLRDPMLRRLVMLMLPATFGASIHQVNILLSTAFATSLGREPLSWLYAADRLVELPLGVFAVSVAVASLPQLAEHAQAGRIERYKTTLADALRQMLYVILPSAAGLAVLAFPIVAVVYQRGRFDAGDTLRTAQALAVYAAGIPAIGATRVAVQGFYALEDTRTPVLVGILSVAVFGGSTWLLIGPWGFLGIAAGVGIAAWVNFLTVLALLRRRVGRLGLRRVAGTVGRSLVGLAAMALAAWGVSRLGAWSAGAGDLGFDTWRNLVVLAAAVLAGAGAYLAATLALGAGEATAVLARVRRRFGGRS